HSSRKMDSKQFALDNRHSIIKLFDPRTLPQFCVNSQKPFLGCQMPESTFQRRLSIKVKVYVHIVTHQVGHHLRIDAKLTHHTSTNFNAARSLRRSSD